MKIEFTKKQFETLLKAVYLGARTANAYEDDLEGNEYVELQKYIFGFAKDFGIEKYADYDEKLKVAWPSAALEEDEVLNELIDRYDDFTFLDKLIYNLAGRDMLDKHGPKTLEKMSDDEFFKEEEAFAEKYRKEFAKNGIKNLAISRGK